MGYWYMLFLWQCYLFTHIYNLLCPVLQNKKLRYLCDAAWVIAIAVGFRIFGKMAGVDAVSLVGSGWIYWLYPFFFAGYVLHRDNLFLSLFDNRQRLFDLSGVAFLPLMAYLAICGYNFVVRDCANLFAVYVIVWLFYKYRNTSHWIKNVLETMGRQSLAIYLFHYFFVKSFDLTDVGQQFAGDNPFLTTMLAIVLACLIGIICVAISWLVRQNNILAFLFLGTIKRNTLKE